MIFLRLFNFSWFSSDCSKVFLLGFMVFVLRFLIGFLCTFLALLFYTLLR